MEEKLADFAASSKDWLDLRAEEVLGPRNALADPLVNGVELLDQ